MTVILVSQRGFALPRWESQTGILGERENCTRTDKGPRHMPGDLITTTRTKDEEESIDGAEGIERDWVT